MDIPFSVGQYFYFGISDGIKSESRSIESLNTWNQTQLPTIIRSLERNILEIQEAIEFYKKYVIVSVSHLEREFDELKQKYEAAIGPLTEPKLLEQS